MSFRCGNQGLEMWEACCKLKVAALTYLPIYKTDLTKYSSREPKELWAKLSPNQKASLYRFVYEMQEGDIIYAKKGTSIVGRGVVTGSYQFVYNSSLICPDNEQWSHQRPVDWESNFDPVEILLGAEPITVLQLSGERLQKLEEVITINTVVVSDLDSLSVEEASFEEGGKRYGFTNYYERNPKLRAAAIQCHGTKCMVCEFDFEKVYGEHGRGYIEAHHLHPISSIKKRTKVDPNTAMAVVCSNCHRMIHRNKNSILSLEHLKELIQQAKS